MPRGRPLGLTRLGERLVLWRRADGSIACFEDRCCHRGAALSPGRIVEGNLECPYHGFLFDGDGQCTKMPCQGKDYEIPKSYRVRSYPVREHCGLLWVWFGAPRLELPELPWFDDLPASPRGSAMYQQVWPFHYTRIMEQMFDLHHAAFAHRTIGGGLLFGTLIEDIDASLEGDLIRFAGVIRKEDKAKGQPFRITARLSITCLRIGEGLRGLVVVTPIDASSCWIFTRLFHDVTSVPGLSWLVSYLGLLSDFRLAQPQDKAIIASQSPEVADLRANKLVSADRGVLLWHRLHARLLAAEAEAQPLVTLEDRRADAQPTRAPEVRVG
ncbi:MAG: Rieske 2Fe-2S domain-containing protein [Myxococcales bacterium]|nr:Rieske 2Fe-2S domain-containing protein [Myxococcales bacterium]